MGEESLRIARGARVAGFIHLPHAMGAQLQVHAPHKINQWAIASRSLCQRERLELRGFDVSSVLARIKMHLRRSLDLFAHIFSHFKLARTQAGTYRSNQAPTTRARDSCTDARGVKLLHVRNSCGQHACNDSAPSCVHTRDDTSIRRCEKHRAAVCNAHSEQQRWIVCHDRVGLHGLPLRVNIATS
jgi:hypothetical protein